MNVDVLRGDGNALSRVNKPLDSELDNVFAGSAPRDGFFSYPPLERIRLLYLPN